MDDDGRVQRDARRDGLRHLDQRRLLRPPPRDLRLHAEGEELVEEPFQRLIAGRPAARAAPRGLLGADGHAQGQAVLENLHEDGSAPWQVWDPDRVARPRAGARAPPDDAAAAARPARGAAGARARVGAHPDDIEIGCGGTLLKLIEQAAVSEVHWVVLSGEGERARGGARAAPRRCSSGVPRSRGRCVCDFRDGFFPYEGSEIKDFFEAAEGRRRARPGLHPPARRPAPGPPRSAAS